MLFRQSYFPLMGTVSVGLGSRLPLTHLNFECTGDTPIHHPLTCFSTGEPVSPGLHTQRARQPPRSLAYWFSEYMAVNSSLTFQGPAQGRRSTRASLMRIQCHCPFSKDFLWQRGTSLSLYFGNISGCNTVKHR